jgi:uncharacterized C2H2 Zn-finger protein
MKERTPSSRRFASEWDDDAVARNLLLIAVIARCWLSTQRDPFSVKRTCCLKQHSIRCLDTQRCTRVYHYHHFRTWKVEESHLYRFQRPAPVEISVARHKTYLAVIPLGSVGLHKLKCNLYTTLTQNLLNFFVHLKYVAIAGKHVTIQVVQGSLSAGLPRIKWVNTERRCWWWL